MSRRPLLRRLAGAVALVGCVLVGSLILRGLSSMVTVAVHFRLGVPAPARVAAEYRRPGESDVLGRFETTLTEQPVVHRARLPRGPIEATVRVADGPPVVRRFEAEDDREITLELVASDR